MEKKNNGLLIVIIIILALSTIGLGGYTIYDKLIKEDKVTEQSEKNNEKEVTKELVWTNEKNDPEVVHKVEYLDGKLYVDNKELVDNIKSYTLYTQGIDIGEGKTYVLMIRNDGRLSSLFIDMLSIKNSIDLKDNVLDNYGIVKELSTKCSQAPNEPKLCDIYALIDDQKINITEKVTG